MAKRSFSSDDLKMKSVDYHGSANYDNTTLDVVAKGVDAMNVHFTFEEALKLSLAIQACLMNLNKYNRAVGGKGSKMGLSLAFKTNSKSVQVIETEV